MLTTIRDSSGNILAACDWFTVNDKGQPEPMGLYVYVNKLEIGPSISGHRIIPMIIEDIAYRTPWTIGAYWERHIGDIKQLRGYSRTRLLRKELIST